MEYINSTNLRTHLDRFLQKAQTGHSFVVTLFGKPVAYVGPLRERQPGEHIKRQVSAKGAAGLLGNVPAKNLEKFDHHSLRRPLFDS